MQSPTFKPIFWTEYNLTLHLTLYKSYKKKATHTAEMMSVLCVAIFWVVKASRNEKSCL